MRRRIGMWSYAVYLAFVLVIALVAASVFVVVTVRRSFPDTSGTVQLSGLHGDVRVVRDGHGIPQIYADRATDLFAAQGYVQAQDRFFQMDFRRHVGSGRLAEMFGRGGLEADKLARTLGWRRVAREELKSLRPSTRRYLKAYARGVNAYIEDKSADELSLEYSLLDVTSPSYKPARWTAVDSLTWLKVMAWELRGNSADEIDRVLATTKVSRSMVEQLYPQFPRKRHDPTVSTRDARTAVRPLRNVAAAEHAAPTLLGATDGVGSNAWAVSGDRTATGEPLLAGDPHLVPSMPGVWYQMGLHCRTRSPKCPFDVSGFTFAGMPGVVIGHNQRIAWSLTTMYADVSDLYLEKVRGDTYLYDGRRHKLTTRKERITVAGRDKPVTITVRSTRHGPLLSDIETRAKQAGARARPGHPYAVSLQWTGLQPSSTMDAVFAIDRARSFQQLHAAARLFDAPCQNIVYADTSGHIGYQAPGVIPVRKRGDGRWPVPGWDASYGWKGHIPYDELPSVLDPADGYVVSSNQPVTGPRYPYLIGTDQEPGYRSQRIIDLIEHDDALTVQDMTRMQRDTYNANAAQIVPYLEHLPVGGHYYREPLNLLLHWDFTQPPDSAAAAYFNVFWRNLLALTFHDQLPKEVWPSGGERWFEVVRKLLRRPASPWWDDARTKIKQETRDEILVRAMRSARQEMTRRDSVYPSRWAWGDLHTLTLTNRTLGSSGIAIVERLFNRGPYRLAGSAGVVDATAWDATQGYQVTAGPSMRMVVDLSDLDRSRWIQLTGESGHAFDSHYTDQTDLWAEGRTLPWAFSRDAVAQREDSTLTLSPDAPSG